MGMLVRSERASREEETGIEEERCNESVSKCLISVTRCCISYEIEFNASRERLGGSIEGASCYPMRPWPAN